MTQKRCAARVRRAAVQEDARKAADEGRVAVRHAAVPWTSTAVEAQLVTHLKGRVVVEGRTGSAHGSGGSINDGSGGVAVGGIVCSVEQAGGGALGGTGGPTVTRHMSRVSALL